MTSPTGKSANFKGWFNGDTEWTATDKVENDLTLTAKYTWTVSFMSNGEEFAKQTVEHNKTATKPATDPTRDGYKFNGWKNGDVAFDFATAIIDNVTLTADWQINSYTVTFNANGGEGDVKIISDITHGTLYVFDNAPEYTKANHSFVGWSTNENATEALENVTVNDNVTLYAVWKINSYTVTFEANYDGAPAIETQTVEHNKTATKPNDPTRDGYKFKGWKNGNEAFDFDTPITADVTLTAEWEALVGWNLVTDVSTLKAGDKVIIAAAAADDAFALGNQSGNNCPHAEIIKGEKVDSISSTVQILTLEAGTKEGTFAFNTGSGYLYAASSEKNYLWTEETLSDNSSFTITIGSDGVATIKAQGTNTRNLLRYNSGSDLFSCYASGQDNVVIYKFYGENVPNPEKVSEVVVYLTNEYSGKEYTESFNLPVEKDGVNITWSCESDSLTIDENGNVEIKRNETDTPVSLTAELSVTGVFETTKISVTIKGTLVTAWTLVTDANTLAVGDQIVIVAANSDFAMSTTQNKNNRGQIDITKNSDNTITINASVQILTLGTGTKDGTFAFNTGSGYLYAAHSSENYLRTETELDDNGNGSFTITIDSNGVATIKAQGTNTVNWLRYNSGSDLFSCYESGQADVVIYRLETAGSEGGEGGESGGEVTDPNPDPNPTDPTPDEGEGGGETPAVPTDPVKYTFANYTAGTQYAIDEEHELDDILTVNTTEAHFTTQLRIYSSSSHDGYAIFSSKLAISSIVLNAGNKKDTLNVYTSTDGATWTLAESVAVTSTSYGDYTVNFSTPTKYIKLDVAGTEQVRIKYVTVTYKAEAA